MDELAFRIADVYNHAAGRKSRTELLNDRFDERVLAAGRERDLRAVGHRYWHTSKVSIPGNFILKARETDKILLQSWLPLPASERAKQ